MMPRLYSCFFGVAEGKAWPEDWYRRHARVLHYSARRNTPGWEIVVEQIAPSRPIAGCYPGATAAFFYNTHKLERWNREVQQAPDGTVLLVCDADLAVLRSLDPVLGMDFDVAITSKRDHTRIPLNGGVVFARVNARSRAWFAAWLDWNMRLLRDSKLHQRWRAVYAGMNQAAMGALLENGGTEIAKVLELPCTEWNCESASWRFFDARKPPRIVHVKGAMRRGLMDRGNVNALATAERRSIADVWWALERDALAAEEAASHG